jgi:hypothetical protein
MWGLFVIYVTGTYSVLGHSDESVFLQTKSLVHEHPDPQDNISDASVAHVEFAERLATQHTTLLLAGDSLTWHWFRTFIFAINPSHRITTTVHVLEGTRYRQLPKFQQRPMGKPFKNSNNFVNATLGESYVNLSLPSGRHLILGNMYLYGFDVAGTGGKFLFAPKEEVLSVFNKYDYVVINLGAHLHTRTNMRRHAALMGDVIEKYMVMPGHVGVMREVTPSHFNSDDGSFERTWPITCSEGNAGKILKGQRWRNDIIHEYAARKFCNITVMEAFAPMLPQWRWHVGNRGDCRHFQANARAHLPMLYSLADALTAAQAPEAQRCFGKHINSRMR